MNLPRIKLSASRRRGLSRRARPNLAPMAILVVWATAPAFARVDLGRVYRATLDHERRPRGQDWTASEDDVWLLEQFTFVFGRQLALRVADADLVIGRSGTNVVWAAVLPRVPGEILAAPAGQGEKVTSIFLRFHPSLVRQLFPETESGGLVVHAGLDGLFAKGGDATSVEHDGELCA